MIKTLSLQHANMDYIPALERWYYAVHSAQVARRFGPWLARHESYMPVYSPPEAEKWGASIGDLSIPTGTRFPKA